ncbi:MAG: hypothetical protein IT406_01070 [Candidatus Yanofskybacteria bacterium]|nr:hypothetical protein [Candidatus Yanofskybacteria bacterium]
MHITSRFIIICREAFLTAGSNNLNLIGIFTQINADRFPFVYPQFALVVSIDVDDGGTHTMEADVIGPGGARIARSELPLQARTGNMQVIANFEQMQFAAPGTYTFRVSIDGTSLGERALEVKPVIAPGPEKNNLA